MINKLLIITLKNVLKVFVLLIQATKHVNNFQDLNLTIKNENQHHFLVEVNLLVVLIKCDHYLLMTTVTKTSYSKSFYKFCKINLIIQYL